MLVEAKLPCPICTKTTKIVSFDISAADGCDTLDFYCPHCNIEVRAVALRHIIYPNKIVFDQFVGNLQHITWKGPKSFNPTER